MSPQETQALQDFLNQLIQVRGIPKDPQADALISSAVAQQPDAAYLLVQRALLVEQSLNAAKAQIASLEAQLRSARPAETPGFLDAASAWGNHANAGARPVMPAPAPSAAPPVPAQSPAPQAAPAAAAPGFLGGMGGGMLGNIAATAAGVAGGAFLFRGIENLMGHHSASGFLNQPGMAPLAAPVENSAAGKDHGSDQAAKDHGSDQADKSDDLFDDASGDSVFDDSGSNDDSSLI